MINRGLIEGEVQPSYDSLTKKEIVELLEEKGIAYNARAKKEELIEAFLSYSSTNRAFKLESETSSASH